MKFLDWGILAYWALDHPKFGEKATKILKHIELSERAVTTALDLFILDASLRQSAIEGYAFPKVLAEVERLRNLRVEPVDDGLLRRGSEAAARFGVPLEIGLGYACARTREADAVYSFEPSWDRTDLPRRSAP